MSCSLFLPATAQKFMDLPLTQSLLLEASTNLIDWEAVTYMYRSSMEGPLHFSDTFATNQPMRFYRFTQP